MKYFICALTLLFLAYCCYKEVTIVTPQTSPDSYSEIIVDSVVEVYGCTLYKGVNVATISASTKYNNDDKLWMYFVK